MLKACDRSCFVCSDGGGGAAGCSDLHPKCGEWAKDKQCINNRDWMEENCRSVFIMFSIDEDDFTCHFFEIILWKVPAL